MSIFAELQQAIIDGKAPLAKELTDRGLKEGIKPHEFFPAAIIPAMDEVGRRMRDCEFFIPEVLIAARAAEAPRTSSGRCSRARKLSSPRAQWSSGR